MPLSLHFKPKQVGKGREIEKIKNVVPFRSHPTRNRKFQKKQQKIKKPCLASFQAKIGWKRLKKRENKNYRFVSFQPDGRQKIPKNKKIPLWLQFKPKQAGKGREIEKIKIIVPFRSHLTRNRKFQKKWKKISKN